MRRTPLQRRSALRSRPRRVNRSEPGRVEWKTSRAGFCECGCDRFTMHLHRHHVVTESAVREAGGDPWDMRNSMLLAERCHLNHHAAHRRIPLERVPESALAFAVDLLGEDRAVLWFARYYGGQTA